MIEYRTGNILDAEVEALVNSVNCVGVMGRGVALQFKKAFPENFKAYRAACRRGEVVPGRMFVFETGLLRPRYIINFPTKRHWRGKARMEDIEAGLRALVEEVVQRGIRSIAMPPLGCGLGGLEWEKVRRRIEQAFSDLPEVRALLYEPQVGVPLPPSVRRGPVPKMTPGRAALVDLMCRYVQGLLDPSISLLELHKLMYFAQEAGEPLRLRFVKGPYGPYAENLRHVLHAIEGYYISGYGAGGDEPRKVLELVPGALEDARRVLEAHEETQERLRRVVELIEGFESPYGLELLATVHWIATKDKATSDEELIARFYAWHERKGRFTRNQILLAARVLQKKGWIES
jgi:O-acetyl-ADP-ribose deacetylase (regulator of RNase III)